MDLESQTVALELLAFGPADIERLTGVTRESQRDWRRRGIAGPRRFGHVGDLITFYLIRQIGKVMGDLVAAAPVAAMFTPAVLFRVARDRRAWSDDSLAASAADSAALVLRALGQTVPPDGSCGFHCDGVTLIAADYAEGRDHFRQIGASGLLVSADFDLVAASFLARAAGQPFARLTPATPAETALLNLQKGPRLQ
jgi:hypothetical protein